MITLSSWNVNGIRAALNKGFEEYAQSGIADILCLQETKATADQVDLTSLGEYQAIWNSAEKKGYSGTAVFTRLKPKNVSLGMGIEEHDKEGRVIHVEFDDFNLVNVYTPNSQRGLTRLPYRMEWDQAFRGFLGKLKRKRKPLVFCGDLNCAHQEIDLANPKSNRKNAGFTDDERGSLTELLDSGFVDTFRHFDDSPGQYSWWTYRSNARERNIGWRLDYWCITRKHISSVKASRIRSEVFGSDHCPVEMDLEI